MVNIIIHENNNIIQVELLKVKHSFYKNNINCIFWNEANVEILSELNKEKLSTYEATKTQFKYHILFCYGYEGCIETLEYLQKYSFWFLDFINLNFFWYAILEDNKIYEENIHSSLEDNLILEIKTDYSKYTDIEKNIEAIKTDIFHFKDEINKKNLQELEYRKKNIIGKYQELNSYIDNIKIKFTDIYQILNSKINILKDLETKRRNKTINNVNSGIKKEAENKNQYLFKLYSYIDDTENKKKYALQSLNQVNSLMDEKKKILSEMQGKIDKLQIKNKELEIKHQNLQNKKIIPPIIQSNNIAVFIHLFNYHLYDEIYAYLEKLLIQVKFDLYVNLAVTNKSDLQQPPIQRFLAKLNLQKLSSNLYLTVSNNRGMDIGGFMMSYVKMLELNLKYESIIKIHSKTNNNWRFAMLYSLLGSDKIIRNNLALIRRPDIGMIGNQTLNLKHMTNRNLYSYIEEYMSLFNIDKMEGKFIPGTIFWIKGSILQKYFTKSRLQKCYQQYLPDYCGLKNNKREGRPHAFERFFGLLVENSGLQTVRFDS